MLEILLDPQDIHLWALPWRVDNKGYIRRCFTECGVEHQVLLHRVVMNAPPGVFVDHANGNTLDNRRCNLRFCTHAENMRNRSVGKNNALGVKGVYLYKNRFWAQIRDNGRKYGLGCYVNLEDARAAYNKAAAELHGEFARLS